LRHAGELLGRARRQRAQAAEALAQRRDRRQVVELAEAGQLELRRLLTEVVEALLRQLELRELRVVQLDRQARRQAEANLEVVQRGLQGRLGLGDAETRGEELAERLVDLHARNLAA